MAQRRLRKGEDPEEEPVLRVKRSQLDTEIVNRLELGQELLDRPAQTMTDVEELEDEFQTWDEFNEQLLRSRFTTSKVADEYKRVTVGFGGGRASPQQELHWLRQSIADQRRRLQSIRQKLELYNSEIGEGEVAGSPRGVPQGTKVFVVHGHDGDIKYQVVGLLEKITGERSVILHEQVDSGQTIIEKFEAHASEAGFAVVLLTADDVGRANTESELRPRARQNVVLELGFFIGSLGRDHVVALYQPGVELPSDLSGVLYKELTGNWQIELARELQAAGIDVDLGKLLRG